MVRLKFVGNEGMERKPALFLDLDGTVRKTKSGKVCPNTPDDQELLPGRAEKIREYKEKGYKIIAVTNQGGIGLGYMSSGACEEILGKLDEMLGYVFDRMMYAPAAPQKQDPWTKPQAGMLFHAEADMAIDLKRSVMVGDMATDKECAEKAGVKFVWAKDFFDDGRRNDQNEDKVS